MPGFNYSRSDYFFPFYKQPLVWKPIKQDTWFACQVHVPRVCSHGLMLSLPVSTGMNSVHTGFSRFQAGIGSNGSLKAASFLPSALTLSHAMEGLQGLLTDFLPASGRSIGGKWG